ncbi:uncharacterized protein LOC126891479 [Diabrotica virgifera virgifera]|uniref:Uncharacterized protein LOC114344346 n=1 Tax=Diabrotica virgifera virgifera TaxID=50390 RepID=A0A6P7GY06_DIAVI|nr:uncharacterized protein LOC126884905 [Diabrotica virgifera virgifera]XP_050516614.1 uncharacterized protein LOC126891479 [Diabrotica virgifera virgifera]
MSGRKEDPIWQFYIKTTNPNKLGCRAICRKCRKDIQGLVQRLKAHHDVCNYQERNTAYMLNPQKTKYQLTPEEKNIALETINELYENTGLLPLVIKLNARSAPFKQVMFSDEVIKNVNGLQWWLSQKDEPEILKQLPIIKQFLCATASSASVERVFSSFGLVHSDIRNRLGIEKGGKLVFLFKLYNENE